MLKVVAVVAAKVEGVAVFRLEGDNGVAGVRTGKQPGKWEVKVVVVREANRPRERRYNKLVVKLLREEEAVVVAVAVKVKVVRAVVIFPRCRNVFSPVFRI